MHHEAVTFSNVSASQPVTITLGGRYRMSVSATFGGGSVKLQQLSPDGSTFVDLEAPFNNAGTEVDLVVGTFSANGSKEFVLSPGTYQVTIATATAVYVAIARAPLA